MKYAIILIAVLISFQITAQVKYEREVRVRADEVPEKAVEWIDSTFTGTKRGFRWFHEISIDKQSYEAKFRWRNVRYSVKFDTTGILDDVEFEIDWYDISEIARTNINNYLEANFISHKTLRIQRQLTGPPHDLQRFILYNTAYNPTINYELEIRARKEHMNELWEAFFDSEGKFLSLQLIVLTPPTHLDF